MTEMGRNSPVLGKDEQGYLVGFFHLVLFFVACQMRSWKCHALITSKQQGFYIALPAEVGVRYREGLHISLRDHQILRRLPSLHSHFLLQATLFASKSGGEGGELAARLWLPACSREETKDGRENRRPRISQSCKVFLLPAYRWVALFPCSHSLCN